MASINSLEGMLNVSTGTHLRVEYVKYLCYDGKPLKLLNKPLRVSLVEGFLLSVLPVQGKDYTNGLKILLCDTPESKKAVWAGSLSTGANPLEYLEAWRGGSLRDPSVAEGIVRRALPEQVLSVTGLGCLDLQVVGGKNVKIYDNFALRAANREFKERFGQLRSGGLPFLYVE